MTLWVVAISNWLVSGLSSTGNCGEVERICERLLWVDIWDFFQRSWSILYCRITMFSSFTSFSNPFSVPRFLQAKPSSSINLSPVQIHNIETTPDRRARTLKHLLKLNHANHAILFNYLRFHNHLPHVRPLATCQPALSQLLTSPRYSDRHTSWNLLQPI